MAAGLTASLTKDDLDRAIGERLLRIETTLAELAEIKAWTDGYTPATLSAFFAGALTETDASDIKGALAHAAAAQATWDGANHVFIDRLTAPGVRI